MSLVEILGVPSSWPQALGFWTLVSAGGVLLLTLLTSQMAASLDSIEAMLDDRTDA